MISSSTDVVTPILYDDDLENIHATYDPLANPATADANGIVFAVGFEDKMFFPAVGEQAGAPNQCNFERSAAFPYTTLPVGCTCRGGCAYSNYWWDRRDYPTYSHYPDPKGKHFTRCRSDDTCGDGDGSCSDFGVAGSDCTATMSWNGTLASAVGRADADHRIWTTEGTADTVHPTKGFSHFYMRWYAKIAGVTSNECVPGYPNCPAAVLTGGGGLYSKGIEFVPNRDDGGVFMMNLAHSNDGAMFPGRSSCTEGFYESPQQGDNSGQFLRQNPPTYAADPPNATGEIRPITNYADQWIFYEVYVKIDTTFSPAQGEYKVWADECGFNGRGCSGTPTLRAHYTGVRIGQWRPLSYCVPVTSIKTMWLNFFSNFPNYEYQIDEIMIRDADVLNDPIGFAPVIN